MFQFNSRCAAFLVFISGLVACDLPLMAAPLPPDLTIESHDQFFGTNSNGEKILLFSTWTINRGTGPLELHGGATHDGMQDVYQWIFDSDGSHTERLAGTFVTINNRLRFDDSADYFLREVTSDDGVGGVVAATQKVAYCLVDTQKAPSPPPGTPATAQYGGVYPACGQIMGISVGWLDLYSFQLANQSIVLTGVSSGTYWLEMVADPLNRLAESDETNNSSRVKVTLPDAGFSPEINLVGNGQSIAAGDSNPSLADHTDFGYADVASGVVTRTFTIENSGTGTLSLPGVPKVQIAGSSDFSVVAQPTSPVAPNGGSITFQIAFDPSALGVRTATVSISNNDADESSYQFAIRGNADLDNDGMPDGWETLYNVSDPNADDDGDGMSNLDEFIAGTSPRDPASALRIKEAKFGANGCEITFDSINARLYRVEYKNDFSLGWTLLQEKLGTGSPITVNDPGALGQQERFYRLTTGF
jgi:hypothetical protein